MTIAELITTKPRLTNVQVLRAVAVLLVVLVHSVDRTLDYAPRSFFSTHVDAGNIGAIGVDLFFVISGFVMAYSVAGKGGWRDTGVFLALRWIRIAPAYIVVCAILAVLALAEGRSTSIRSLANVLFFVPWFDTASYSRPPLTIGWTLSFEFTFYLFVALLVVLRQADRPWILAAGLVALVAIGTALQHPPFLVSWFTNPILLEFVLGICAYYLWRHGLLARMRPLWWGLGVAGVGALVVEVIVGYGPIAAMGGILNGHDSLRRVLLWGVPSALVFLAVVAAPAWGRHRGGRPAALIGDASYSIYLVHASIGTAALGVLSLVPIHLPIVIVLLVCGIAGVVGGFLYFRLLERPLTHVLRRLVERPR